MSKKNKAMKHESSNRSQNEKFGLRNIPKNFELVTDDEVKRIRERVLNESENISHNKPGALDSILGGVDGSFESAYSTLEDNYGKVLGNLSDVRKKGFAVLRQTSDDFALQVAEYNNALQDYLEASRNIGVRGLPESLLISDEEIAEIKQSVNELERRRKNG